MIESERKLTPKEVYQRRVDEFSAVVKRYAAQERLATQLRLAAFAAAVVLFIVGRNSSTGTAWYVLGGLALACFVAAVFFHEHIRGQIRRFGILRAINEQALARLRRDWKHIPEPAVAVPPPQQDLSDDLDLFGHASLYQLLCVANTPIGRDTLRDWIVEPASAEEIRRRQQAIAELAPHLELRQKLDLEGRLLADRGRALTRFLEWTDEKPWLAENRPLLWLLRAMSVTIIVLCILIVLKVLSFDAGAIAILVAMVLNVTATAFVGGKVHGVFESVSLRYNEAGRYASMFNLMHSMPDASPALKAIKGDVTHLGGGVLHGMRHLQRIVRLALIRHSAMLFIFVYLPLQVVFLYDIHILNLLEAWQTKFGGFARRWFTALGNLEALASLAGLAHDNPGWAMPEVEESAATFQATELAHPLLPETSRVANDVQIGPRGTFLLVTGSNMSGKSTLLRAVGVNAVLAMAGGPVCAARLTLPLVALTTSMRLRDSLESGVSYYMAELLRLKRVVEQARDGIAEKGAGKNGRTLVYLLDEILRGTNSKERHIAVVRVMEHLLHHDAIGAISTHDLDLATAPGLAESCSCVHFRETLHDETAEKIMTFDYRLRPGIATTSNALKLLEIVGLEKEEERPSEQADVGKS
jgi:hypothetical protein